MTYSEIYKFLPFEKTKLITKNNLTIVINSAKQHKTQIYLGENKP
jgi:hypothetical protein